MKEHQNNHDELVDWIDALDNLILFNGREDAKKLISQFISHAEAKGLTEEHLRSFPFENTISHHEEVDYPGDWDIEEKIRHYIRWNAFAGAMRAFPSNYITGTPPDGMQPIHPLLLSQLNTMPQKAPF